MKSEKKMTAYLPGYSGKSVEDFIYGYTYFVDELVHATTDKAIRARYFKRKDSRKLQELRSFVNPGERMELQPRVVTRKEHYDLARLKNHCDLIEQKTLLIEKIKAQSEIYVNRNASLLRNLAYNLLGLALSLVAALLYQKLVLSSEPGMGLFGLLFKCISVYLGVSILYQSLKAFVNTIISKHELVFWKKTTVGLLDEQEYRRYITAPLSGLKRSLYVIYPFVFMIYGGLSFYSYQFPQLLQTTTLSWL